MFVAPWILGTVLLVAGLAKIHGRQQFTISIGVLVQSARVRQAIGWALPILELCTGAMLLVVPLRGPGSVLAILLCLLFVLIALDTILSNKQLNCNCFGPFSRGTLGISGLVRNGLLLILAMITIVREYSISFFALAVPLIAAIAVISIIGISSRFVMRRYVDSDDVESFPILIDPDQYAGTIISNRIVEHLAINIQNSSETSVLSSQCEPVYQNTESISSVIVIGNDMCGDCKVLEDQLRQSLEVRAIDVVFVKSLHSVADQGDKPDSIQTWYRTVFSNNLLATVLPCALFIASTGKVHFVEEGSTSIFERLVEV